MSDKPATPPVVATRRLPGLEALRCVAAVCVLLLHTRAVFGGRFFYGRGYLGVDFFLMLSGFLMARVQEPRLAEGLSPLAFLRARYLRLWPMMALGGLIGVPLQFVRSSGWGQFAWVTLANLALLPVAGQPFVFPLNIPAWTIFYELVANAAHVLLLRHLRGIWLGAAIAALMAAMAFVGAHFQSFDLGAKPANFLFGLPRILLAYLIGMALARAWRTRRPPPVPPLLALVIMPALLPLAWWLGVSNTHWGWQFDLGFVILVCPLMIAGGVRLRRFGTAAGLIGSLAFPLFALQMPILQAMRQLGCGAVAGFGAAVAGGIGAAGFSSWRAARRRQITAIG